MLVVIYIVGFWGLNHAPDNTVATSITFIQLHYSSTILNI